MNYICTPMRRLLPFLLSLCILASCTDEPKSKTGTDTLKPGNDTTAVRDSVNDTTATNNTPKYDCSVLRRRIPDEKQEAAIQRDLNELRHCGIDSFDFLYIVPNLFPGYVSENHIQGRDTVTYGDFLKHLNEFRNTTAYAQLHDRVSTLDSLRSVPYEPKKLYTMKPVLGRLGFSEPEWEMFQGFARTYPLPKKQIFTWGDLLDAFEKYNSSH